MDDLFRTARALGMEDVEFFHSRCSNLAFSTTRSVFKSKEFSFDGGYGVRVVHKKRIGFGYFERKEDCGKALKTALKLSRFSEKSGFSFPKKQSYGKVDVFDKRIRDISEKEGAELMKGLLSGIKKHALPTECSLSFSTSFREISNSNGLYGSYKSTNFICSACANYKGSSSYELTGGILLPKSLFSFGKNAGRNAFLMRGARKLPTAKRTVIFDADGIGPFLSLLIPSFNGDWKRRGISFFCGKEGKQAASPMLTISDDPYADALSKAPFDGEGISSSKKHLIRGGVFRGFLFDRKTAALSGIEEEGNSDRESYSSPPVICPSNMVVSRGSINDLEEECKNPILVHSFQGGHTSDPISGDFSISIDVGFELRKGRRVPIRGNIISGNIFSMLQNISGMEKKQETRMSTISPRIAFEDVLVVG
jgi:PmbA protein